MSATQTTPDAGAYDLVKMKARGEWCSGNGWHDMTIWVCHGLSVVCYWLQYDLFKCCVFIMASVPFTAFSRSHSGDQMLRSQPKISHNAAKFLAQHTIIEALSFSKDVPRIHGQSWIKNKQTLPSLADSRNLKRWKPFWHYRPFWTQPETQFQVACNLATRILAQIDSSCGYFEIGITIV